MGCYHYSTIVREVEFKDGSLHLKRTCTLCGRYLGFVAKKEKAQRKERDHVARREWFLTQLEEVINSSLIHEEAVITAQEMRYQIVAGEEVPIGAYGFIKYCNDTCKGQHEGSTRKAVQAVPQKSRENPGDEEVSETNQNGSRY